MNKHGCVILFAKCIYAVPDSQSKWLSIISNIDNQTTFVRIEMTDGAIHYAKNMLY